MTYFLLRTLFLMGSLILGRDPSERAFPRKLFAPWIPFRKTRLFILRGIFEDLPSRRPIRWWCLTISPGTSSFLWPWDEKAPTKTRSACSGWSLPAIAKCQALTTTAKIGQAVITERSWRACERSESCVLSCIANFGLIPPLSAFLCAQERSHSLCHFYL